MLRDKTNLKRTTLKVNRSRQTTRPLQISRKGIQTKGKNKEGLSNLQQTGNTTNNPTVSSQINTPTYQRTSILQEGQQAQQKEILIPFEQALQVRDVDQIKAHLKIIVGKFQGGCIKLYLHK